MNDIKYGRTIKGIKKELNEKISDWLLSIKDVELREKVAGNVIVTGGSIASMLLGENVNDFDLYFKTKEVTLLVAHHYAEEFNKAHSPAPTGNKKKKKLYVAIIEHTIVNIKGEEEDRVVCVTTGGGTVKEPKDYKKEKGSKYRPVFISENAITLSDKVQLITRFYGEPDKIHDNYDFVHATCYYDVSEKELVTPEAALLSLMSRTLVYHGSLYPIASIFRMKKFLNRGWRITAGQQLKIMWQISEIDLTDFDTITEQLTGVDQAYLHQLISAIKDVDPLAINSSYVANLIDDIF